MRSESPSRWLSSWAACDLALRVVLHLIDSEAFTTFPKVSRFSLLPRSKAFVGEKLGSALQQLIERSTAPGYLHYYSTLRLKQHPVVSRYLSFHLCQVTRFKFQPTRNKVKAALHPKNIATSAPSRGDVSIPPGSTNAKGAESSTAPSRQCFRPSELCVPLCQPCRMCHTQGIIHAKSYAPSRCMLFANTASGAKAAAGVRGDGDSGVRRRSRSGGGGRCVWVVSTPGAPSCSRPSAGYRRTVDKSALVLQGCQFRCEGSLIGTASLIVRVPAYARMRDLMLVWLFARPSK